MGCIKRNWVLNYSVTQEAIVPNRKVWQVSALCVGGGRGISVARGSHAILIGIHFPSLPLASTGKIMLHSDTEDQL